MVIKEATEEFFLEDYDMGAQKWEAFAPLNLKGKSFETAQELKDLLSTVVCCPIDWEDGLWIGEDWVGGFTLSAEDIVAKDDSTFRVATAAEKEAWEQGLQELYSRRVDVVLCDVTDNDVKALSEQGVEIW